MQIPKRGNQKNPKYLAWVKQQECCVCQAPGPSDPHHIIAIGDGRTSGTASDIHAMPACRKCHQAIHASVEWQRSQTLWLIRTQEKAVRDGVL